MKLSPYLLCLLFPALLAGCDQVKALANQGKTDQIQTGQTQANSETSTVQQKFTRKELDDLLKANVGKSPEEVVAILGKPDSVLDTPATQYGPAFSAWSYHHLTRNPITDKPEAAVISFNDGKLNAGINYASGD